MAEVDPNQGRPEAGVAVDEFARAQHQTLAELSSEEAVTLIRIYQHLADRTKAVMYLSMGCFVSVGF